MMKQRLTLAALLGSIALSSAAFAQNQPLFATGTLTPGHALVLQQTGTPGSAVTRDAGSALAGNFTELGITNDGLPLCIRDKSAQHILCFGANALGGGVISYNPLGTAPPLNFSFNINGTTTPFPGPGGGNVLGPTSPPPTAGDVAVWNGGTTLKDGGPLNLPPAVNVITSCGARGDGVTNDGPAIQTCINNLPATGGTITFPAGHTYVSSQTLTIGNGSASAGSTQTGVVLQGGANPLGLSQFGPNVDGTPTLLFTGASGNAISVAGPLNGWGLQNLRIQCQQLSGTTGVLVTSASYADNHNLRISSCQNGVMSTTVATMPSGYTTIDSIHNFWRGTVIELGAAGGAAVTLDGGTGASPTADTDFNIFDDLTIFFPNLSSGLQRGVVLRVADNNILRNTHFTAHGGTQTIQPWVFDYTVNNQFPTENIIDTTDPGILGCNGNCNFNDNQPGGPSNFTNLGTPLYIAEGNRAKFNSLRNLQTTNGAAPPIRLPNLLIDHANTYWTGGPVLNGSTGGTAAAYTDSGGFVTVNDELVTVYFKVGATQANLASLTGVVQIGALPVEAGTSASTDIPACAILENGISFSAGRTQAFVSPVNASFNFNLVEAGGSGSFGNMPVADIGGSGVLFAGTCTYHRGP